MKITVNGKIEDVKKMTVLKLVELKGIEPDSVIVELNREIVRKDLWANLEVNEHDSIEILSLVCGG